MNSAPPSPSAVKQRKRKWRRYFFGALILTGIGLSMPEHFHKNSGVSRSIGSVRDGSLENGWLVPHKGPNFHYFSGVSYYLLDNAYVHSSVYNTLMQSYKTCETTCPGTLFRLMECSNKNGGQMWFHWTHQHGLSVDFMVPTKRGETKTRLSEYTGLAHYLLGYNKDGKLIVSPKTEIDFEVMARHMLALDDAAKANGLRIRKILFHTDLHDNLFSTPSGQELATRNLRFIPRLNDLVNRFHDDHYHVDFETANE
jgi:penicillin-insensitive murein endopeptidase